MQDKVKSVHSKGASYPDATTRAPLSLREDDGLDDVRVRSPWESDRPWGFPSGTCGHLAILFFFHWPVFEKGRPQASLSCLTRLHIQQRETSPGRFPNAEKI